MRRLRTNRAGLAVFLALVTSCGVDASKRSLRADEQASHTGSATTTLTIGDTLVFSTTGVTDSAATLVVYRELAIGVQEGSPEYAFGDVTAAIPTADGGLITWDAIQRQLRRYDSQGVHVRAIGRAGAGPGEYGDLFGMALLPDGALAVWDAQHNRVELYDSAGTYQKSWRATSDLLSSDGLQVDDRGNLLLLIHAEPPAIRVGTEAARRREGFERRNAYSGSILDTILAPIPGPATGRLQVEQRNGSATVRVPFAPELSWAVTRSGALASGDGSEYVIQLTGADTPPRRIERTLRRVELTADERRNHEERLYSIVRRMDPSYSRRLIDIPERKPYFRGIVADDSGRIFVRRYMEASRIGTDVSPAILPNSIPAIQWREPTAYDVFTEDGCYVGLIRLPDRSTLLAPSGNTVWYVARDSLDIPHVIKGSFRSGLSCAEG